MFVLALLTYALVASLGLRPCVFACAAILRSRISCGVSIRGLVRRYILAPVGGALRAHAPIDSCVLVCAFLSLGFVLARV